MPFTIIRQDITKMKVDAIVNAANTALKRGGGVCGAIFNAAGASELQAACDVLAPILTGEAVVTKGFKLPAKWIIHTAGPVYSSGNANEAALLRACYLNSMKQAVAVKCKSMAFPLISSGIYGYPKEEAFRIATQAIQDFLKDNDLEVYLAVFDKAVFQVSEKLLGAVESYIDEHYVTDKQLSSRALLDMEMAVLEEADLRRYIQPDIVQNASIEQLIDNLDESFSDRLLKLIDLSGKTDVEVYKRANLDRKLFSKIRRGKGYVPSKRTAIALSIALELSIDETDELLERAGYALSNSQKFDVIVSYFIINKRFDIYEINEVLFQYDQPLLGG